MTSSLPHSKFFSEEPLEKMSSISFYSFSKFESIFRCSSCFWSFDNFSKLHQNIFANGPIKIRKDKTNFQKCLSLKFPFIGTVHPNKEMQPSKSEKKNKILVVLLCHMQILPSNLSFRYRYLLLQRVKQKYLGLLTFRSYHWCGNRKTKKLCWYLSSKPVLFVKACVFSFFFPVFSFCIKMCISSVSEVPTA